MRNIHFATNNVLMRCEGGICVGADRDVIGHTRVIVAALISILLNMTGMVCLDSHENWQRAVVCHNSVPLLQSILASSSTEVARRKHQTPLCTGLLSILKPL